MSADPDRLKLHRLIAETIAERADGFMQEITSAQVEVPAIDSPEFAGFCLDQEYAAEKWASAMVDDCIQLLREHNRLGAPKLWQFLFAISNGIIAPHLQKLLHAAFRMTPRDIELIERQADFTRSDGLGVRVFKTASIERAFFVACDKTNAVNKILDSLLGADRETVFDNPRRELAFGTSSAPNFEMPTASQINTPTSPKAQPSQYGSQAEAKPTSANPANLDAKLDSAFVKSAGAPERPIDVGATLALPEGKRPRRLGSGAAGQITDLERRSAERKLSDPANNPHMTAREIAAALGISIKAVYEHHDLEPFNTGTKKRLWTTASVLDVRNPYPKK